MCFKNTTIIKAVAMNNNNNSLQFMKLVKSSGWLRISSDNEEQSRTRLLTKPNKSIHTLICVADHWFKRPSELSNLKCMIMKNE